MKKKNLEKNKNNFIFELKKLNMQTFELYKTIYFLKVDLELYLNHINCARPWQIQFSVVYFHILVFYIILFLNILPY